MKKCTRCKTTRTKSEFSWKDKTNGKLNAWCRSCMKEYDALRDNTKGSTKYAKQTKRRQDLRQFLWDYFAAHPCVDCRESDPVVLEFDHRDEDDKTYTISNMVSRGFSQESITKEIEKCDVRCANCHRRRTAKQMGWYQHIT